MPNFRESDPSKIAVGFGGTLNLIVGLLFVLTVVASMALPAHVAEALAGSEAGMPRFFRWLVPTGLIVGLLTRGLLRAATAASGSENVAEDGVLVPELGV